MSIGQHHCQCLKGMVWFLSFKVPLTWRKYCTVHLMTGCCWLSLLQCSSRSGVVLEHTATYGVRRYTNESWLAAHLDRYWYVFGQFLIVCFGHLVDWMLISLFTQIGHPCHLCDHEPWPRGGGSKNYSENQNGRLLTKYESYKSNR